MRTAIIVALTALLFAVSAQAQGVAGPAVGLSLPDNVTIDGPAPPAPPDVIARDPDGRATIRAVRVTTPIRLDGVLDEAIYDEVHAISGFIQQEPRAGEPATQDTEVWLLFDDRNIYVTVRAHEAFLDRMVANEMRHDNNALYMGNDSIIFVFDTFYDRRNGVSFTVNPIGGRAEGQITNERAYNGDYNMVWDVHTGRYDGGWTFEAAVPFKSLRYRPGRQQVWGFNITRNNKWKNESTYVRAMPKSMGPRALMQLSMAPTLVGVEVPQGSKNLEIKPYAIASLNTDNAAVPRVRNDPDGDAGLDVKYGVTQNLTVDLTYNTDFAQVEADEQQVNLTRFSLFFPEKREFFLENRG
ncbi:MAG: carbohydrate binding family 9 domain-containing protein, partial [Acidimicrobiia bacterium]|nr:carbohydrate binding family 9 domain-containing protein [Acidimicrobiia bacterium]